ELLAQVTSLLEKEPALRARVVTSLAGSRLTAPFAETVRIMNYDALMKSFGATAFALSRRVLEVFAYSLGSIFLGLYMMIDRDALRGGLYAIVPRSQHRRLFPRHDEPGDDRRGIYPPTAHNVRAHDCLHVSSFCGVRPAGGPGGRPVSG